MDTLGKRIKLLRTENQMTQEDLAQKLGVTRAALSSWEIARRDPDTETLHKLSDIFNVSVDFLLGKTDVRNPLVYEALKDNSELLEFWEAMQEREDLQLMFKKSKELTPDAVRKIIEIIKLIEDSEDHEYNRK